MSEINDFYNNRLVIKPWGSEYTIYKNSNRLAITFLNIKHKQKTSLHCHPIKKTGFIILKGTAKVQIGLYKSNIKEYGPLSRLVFRPGLFHSLEATSKGGVNALEFETPVNKKDLIRFKDEYGREKKPYEGVKYTRRINSKLIKFAKPKYGKSQKCKINNLEISLEVHKDFKHLIKKNDNSVSAILNGKIIDSKKQNVICHGEIVKTKTLKKLSEVFKIDKFLTILRVKKIKSEKLK